MSPAPTFCVIYRWDVHPGKEEQFEKAWAEMTGLIRTHRGGLGSRLHQAEDGSFVAYAQWPDRATWENSASIPLPQNTAQARMKEAASKAHGAMPLCLLADLLAR